eukprot:jgi/Psemu1/20375/gm1.20375_g
MLFFDNPDNNVITETETDDTDDDDFSTHGWHQVDPTLNFCIPFYRVYIMQRANAF